MHILTMPGLLSVLDNARRSERIIRLTATLTAACLFVSSCQSAAPAYTGPGALVSGNWTKVRKNPPTYFPKGRPASSPTAVQDGSWVSVGDPEGSRFFIPARGHGGLSPQQLTDEALAEVRPEQRTHMEGTVGERVTENLLKVVGTIVGGAIVVAAILYSLQQDDDDDDWDF